MPTSKLLMKKRAAALKLKLKKAAEVHEQARLDALQHAQEAEDLEAAFEEEEVSEPVFYVPEPPAPQLRDTPRPQPEPVLDIPVKRSWWKRLFD